MEGWRPIETAPKDGTRVLLAGVAHGQAVVGEWWSDRDMSGSRAQWVVDFSGHISGADPTHWMPLPAPPTA